MWVMWLFRGASLQSAKAGKPVTGGRSCLYVYILEEKPVTTVLWRRHGCTLYRYVDWTLTLRNVKNARCLLVCTVQLSHVVIWRGLRWLRHHMMCSKMASSPPLNMHNEFLPQGRLLQAVPLTTHLGPPSMAWSILRQPESVKIVTKIRQHVESK